MRDDSPEDQPRLDAAAKTASDRPLEATDRSFFESRFHRNFADVRIHADRRADESARALDARAFTVGDNITFAQGEYRPGTHAGRHLLAHELAHVVQQRTNSATLPVVQRQPAGKTNKPAPAKVPTLKSQGVSVTDPVHAKTAQVIDTVLARNKSLAPYIGARFKAGSFIAEKGKFVRQMSDGNFENAYRNAYDLDAGDHVSKDILGFFDSKKSIIHIRPGATFGTALHESIHRLATPALYTTYLPIAAKVSSDLAEVLKEGVTAYFTDLVLKDEGLTRHVDKYAKLRKKAEKLITALGSNGFDLIAKFNFEGTNVMDIGNALGITTQQYVALKDKAFQAVFKRMDALL